MRKPVIAIVGRPNVGKSTLFNRLLGTRSAIVESEPGVTRDRIYGEAEWFNKRFYVVDTGGIELDSTDDLLVQSRIQAEIAMEEADLILFVVDGRDGVTPLDESIAQMLRKAQRPVILVVNKIDTLELEMNIFEFYSLGFDKIIGISADHGKNVGDLVEMCFEYLPHLDADDYEDDVIKVAVIGRPNVGKSSIVNSLLGQQRVIVSDIPGTTRDAIDTPFTWDGTSFVIIDTAGMRRRKKIEESIERYSVLRALQAVERSDVAIVVLDATDGVTEQDQRIAGFAEEKGKGIVLAMNKWDLVVKDSQTMNEYEQMVRQRLAFLPYAPLTFVSAKTGKRLTELLELTRYVANQHSLRITTGRLNEVLQEAMILTEPPSDKGVRLKIYYGHQVGVKPPSFLLYVNRKDLFHYSYERYIENRLRESFGFTGTPIRIIVKERR